MTNSDTISTSAQYFIRKEGGMGFFQFVNIYYPNDYSKFYILDEFEKQKLHDKWKNEHCEYFDENLFNEKIRRQIERGDFDFSGYTFNKFFYDKVVFPAVNFFFTRFEGETSFCYAKFQGEANFGATEFRKKANFQHAEFNEDANFNQAEFRDIAYFHYIKFSNIACFGSVKFEQGASFQYAEFRGKAIFNSAEFKNITNFTDVKFEAQVNFENTEFQNSTFFHRVKFKDCCFFIDVNFKGLAMFYEAEFWGDARFHQTHCWGNARFHQTHCWGNVQFSKAKFKKKVSFWNNKFDFANFEEAEFNGYAHFSKVEFNSQVSFVEAEFNSQVDFHQPKFIKGVNFSQVKFSKFSRFKGAIFGIKKSCLYPLKSPNTDRTTKLTYFEAANFEGRVLFHDCNFYHDVIFNNCFFKYSGVFDKVVFAFVPDFRFVSYRNSNFRFDTAIIPNIEELTIVKKINKNETERLKLYLELQYRFKALKELAIASNDHKSEIEFYGEELEATRLSYKIRKKRKLRVMKMVDNILFPKAKMERVKKFLAFKPLFKNKKNTDNFSYFILSIFYKCLSNYGRSFVRPFYWWLCSVVLSIAFLFLCSYFMCVSKRIKFFFILVSPFPYYDYDYITHSVILSFGSLELLIHFFIIALKLWNTLLTFLFFLGLRNQFKIRGSS